MTKQGFTIASISHKYVMAAAGAFLMLFLISHLTTNLLLLAGDGGKKFDAAVEFLLTNPLIKIVEYFLFAGFIIHIIIGIIIEIHNRRSRPVGYYVQGKSGTSAFSRFMIHSGVVIFVFLILHLYHFFGVKIGLVEPYADASTTHDFFPMIVYKLQNPLVAGVYILSFIVLGLHLKHAFQSAFQSFGLNHNKYTPALKIIGAVYAAAISLGFIAIAVYFLFIYKG